jgi:hypothetical protein
VFKERGEEGLRQNQIDLTDRRTSITKLLKYNLEGLKEQLRALWIEQHGTNRDSAYHLEASLRVDSVNPLKNMSSLLL